MEKELHEHPVVIGDVLHRMINAGTRMPTLPDLPFDLAALSRVTISACGSAYHAGLNGAVSGWRAWHKCRRMRM